MGCKVGVSEHGLGLGKLDLRKGYPVGTVGFLGSGSVQEIRSFRFITTV